MTPCHLPIVLSRPAKEGTDASHFLWTIRHWASIFWKSHAYMLRSVSAPSSMSFPGFDFSEIETQEITHKPAVFLPLFFLPKHQGLRQSIFHTLVIWRWNNVGWLTSQGGTPCCVRGSGCHREILLGMSWMHTCVLSAIVVDSVTLW